MLKTLEKIEFELSCMFWDIKALELSSVISDLEKSEMLAQKTKQFQILTNIYNNEKNKAKN